MDLLIGPLNLNVSANAPTAAERAMEARRRVAQAAVTVEEETDSYKISLPGEDAGEESDEEASHQPMEDSSGDLATLVMDEETPTGTIVSILA